MSKYNAKIKYYKTYEPDSFMQYHFKVYTDAKEYAKISGHRFVNLVNNNNIFKNELDLILGFLRMQPPVESEYITAGNILEPKIVDYVANNFDVTDVRTFSFEDLDSGTDDFHFIRDLEYVNEDGQEVTGEIKTFYNRKKLKWNGLIPEPHLTWWLQTRLELEILKEPGGLGRIFYYYVTPSKRKQIVEGKEHYINPKYFFASDYIVKTRKGIPEPMIVNNFRDLGLESFQELMDYALLERDRLMTLYEDEDGVYYQARADIVYDWYHRSNHLEKYIEHLSNYFEIEEI